MSRVKRKTTKPKEMRPMKKAGKVNLKYFKVDQKAVRANMAKAYLNTMGKPKPKMKPMAQSLADSNPQSFEEAEWARYEFREKCPHDWKVISTIKKPDAQVTTYGCAECGSFKTLRVSK